MDTPQKENHEISTYFYKLLDFVLRNGFGILCWLTGLTYQVYQMTGRIKRLTRAQCIFSILLWALSGITVVIGLNYLNLHKMFYGLICWATPIVIKPFADKVAEHSPHLAEKLLALLERVIDKKERKE